MHTSWPVRSLRDVVDIYDGPHATPKKTQSGPFFLGISNLVDGRVDLSEAEHLSEEDFQRWTRRVTPQSGDLVFSYETRLGEAALIPDGLRACLGRRMGLMRVRDNSINKRFLLYAYLGPEFQETIRARTVHGSTVDRIPLIEMPDFPIRLPDRVAQDGIAAVLGTLDDKIELNRKMSATLEAMARALFKSWFVDFDPVRAKAEGRDPGLAPEIAALFPDSFEESELGEIPSGWAFAKLLDIAALNPEIWSKTTRPSVIKYVDLSNVKRGRFERPATFEQSAAPSRAQRVLRPGDTLMGTVRPANGSYGLVADKGLTGSTGFVVLRPMRSKSFTYLAATSKDNIERLGHLADGGAYPAVRPEVVGETRVALPSTNVLCAFDTIATPLLDRYSQAERESGTLAALRGALLPKLISGEIRVTDAERLLERSA